MFLEREERCVRASPARLFRWQLDDIYLFRKKRVGLRNNQRRLRHRANSVRWFRAFEPRLQIPDECLYRILETYRIRIYFLGFLV